jgi:hypothetical protein
MSESCVAENPIAPASEIAMSNLVRLSKKQKSVSDGLNQAVRSSAGPLCAFVIKNPKKQLKVYEAREELRER